MKKNTIRLVIFLSVSSILGILFTQLFWIRNAIDLSEKQFDHRVTIALNEVLEDLGNRSNIAVTLQADTLLWDHNAASIHAVLDTSLLDSLLKAQFDYYCVDTNFTYQIVDCKAKAEFYEDDAILSNRFTVARHKACLSCIWDDECYNLVVFFPMKTQFVLIDMTLWLVASFIFFLIVILSFLYIIKIIIGQKKISEIKNDFINNMTHEFKTPLSTVSMASEILLKSCDNPQKERVHKYAKIIFDENQRLKNHVERILQIAVMDKEGYLLNKVEVDLHQLIRDATDKICLNHCDRPVDLQFNLKMTNPIFFADVLHMKNIVSNLVENAYKYSKLKPVIRISTKIIASELLIIVEDQGIGMNSDTQKHIFDKFFRLHTGDIHDYKGFGLGLHYVKTMVEAHNGTIIVESELNKGSKFIVSIPMS